MPTSGQKDADGYIWNGDNWVSPDGAVKGSSDDKRNKQGFWGDAWDIAKDAASDLKKAETWANPAGPNATGLLGFLGGVNTIVNPISNYGSAAVDVTKGNWKGALFNAGMGTIGVLGGAQGLGGALTLGGRAVKAGSMGSRVFTGMKAATEGATGLRKAGAIYGALNPTKLGKAASALGLGSAGYAISGMLMNKPGQPAASSVLPGPSTTRDMSMTAEQRAAMVAANQNRTDAAGNSGMGGRRTVPATTGAGTGPGRGSAAAAGNLGLLGLDPDQLASTGESLTSLEKMYQDALNQYTLAEQQGQQGYTQSVQGARRQATGTEEDLAGQLAASGLDISPASAFGAGQIANAPRQAQETAARKSLDQLLAEITTGRTQAKTKRDTDKLMINRLINDYRIKNTLAAQQAGYGAMGGY